MNLNKSFINKQRFNSLERSQKEYMKELGFSGYKRNITIFMKENKNMNGIIGHNLVTHVNCLISNYSVSKLSKDETLFNKTVYICDVDFPAHLSFDAIKANLSNVIHAAEIKPAYAFGISHVEKDDGNFLDLGLSMVDLNMKDQSQFAITNFSDNKGNDPKFKELIYSNHYNPKYYTREHAEANRQAKESRNGNINDYVDEHTIITYNNHGSETVDHFNNNIQKTGIYINKKTILASEMITDLFNKLLFISMERLEIVIDTSNPNGMMNITELKFFSKFSRNVSMYYIQEICDNVTEIVKEYKSKFKTDFYAIVRFDEQFVILDLHLPDEINEIRITKPLFKLFGEFSLKNEEIVSEIESQGEIAKLDRIDQICCNPDSYTNLVDTNRMLREAITMIDGYTNQLKQIVADSQMERQNMIADDAWEEKEKYLLSHKL